MFKKLAAFTAFSFISVAFSNPAISKLRDELLEKEVQLSVLGEKIEEKERLIIEMLRSISEVYKWIDKDEITAFKDSITAFCNRFNQASSIPDLKNFIMRELFNDALENCDQLERVKSLLIRRVVEREILKHLMYRYEEQLQVISKINLELIELEKSVSNN